MRWLNREWQWLAIFAILLSAIMLPNWIAVAREEILIILVAVLLIFRFNRIEERFSQLEERIEKNERAIKQPIREDK